MRPSCEQIHAWLDQLHSDKEWRRVTSAYEAVKNRDLSAILDGIGYDLEFYSTLVGDRSLCDDHQARYFDEHIEHRLAIFAARELKVLLKADLPYNHPDKQRQGVAPCIGGMVGQWDHWRCGSMDMGCRKPLTGHCKTHSGIFFLKRTLGESKVEVDHIVPLFRGGSDSFRNLQLMCKECHAKKTAKGGIFFSRPKKSFGKTKYITKRC